MTKPIRASIIYACSVIVGIVGSLPLLNQGYSPLALAVFLLCCATGGLIVIEFNIIDKLTDMFKAYKEQQSGKTNDNQNASRREYGNGNSDKPVRDNRRHRAGEHSRETRGEHFSKQSSRKDGRS